MEKKKITILTIVVFVVGLIIAGSSYAFWSWTSNVNKNVVFNIASNLRNYIVYNEGESAFTGELNVSNGYQTGSIHSTISIYKTTNVNLLATIHMDVNQIGPNMKNSTALKWVVTEGTVTNVGSELAHGNFVGANNGDTLTLVPDINITTTEAFYTVWIWLDSSENPSDNLSGETLDTNVWTEVNQIEGLEDRYEITSTNANYQQISATVVDNKYKVTKYAITTTNSTPSNWTTISPATDQNNVYTLNTSVSGTGTYYIWFIDENDRVISKTVTVSEIDNSAPSCNWGAFTPNTVQNNGTSSVTLTCTDSESGISIYNLQASDFTPSNNKITVTSVTKESVTNGYKYTITVTGTTNDGTSQLTVDANKIRNGVGLGNSSTSSGNIIIANPFTATFYYNSNATNGSTTIASTTETCTATEGSSSCTINIPSAVTSSVGTYNNEYAGLATSTGTMSTAVSKNATTITISADATYYVVYSTQLTIYYPNGVSTCGNNNYYRNQWFTGTSNMGATVVSNSITGTSNITSLSGLSGTFAGYSTNVNTSSITSGLTTIAESIVSRNETTYYAISTYTESVTATFYIYSGSAQTTSTASGTQTRNRYCMDTSNAVSNVNTEGTITVPSAVTSSTGPNSTAYNGLSIVPSSASITTTINTANTAYYAVYGGNYTATFTKENNNVASISSSSLSCSGVYTTDGSAYSGTDCIITMPSITPASGYKSIGWYDSNDIWFSYSNTNVILTKNDTYTAKVKRLTADNLLYNNTKSGVDCNNVQCMIDYLDTDNNITIPNIQLGDYVSYTPIKTSYTTIKAMTGYTSTQTINPSELTLWRVIAINGNGTVDIISKNVSTTDVYFIGQTGYQNLVGYLNVLASQYETTGVTVGSRHFGYNGQTEFITDTQYFVNPAPWTCGTNGASGNCTSDPDDYESSGGGDTLYTNDYNLINNVLGTRVATKLSGSASTYWMASRYYGYSSATYFYWSGRVVYTSGSCGSNTLYGYSSSSFNTLGSSRALRPIVTLSSSLSWSGAGTTNNPWVVQ